MILEQQPSAPENSQEADPEFFQESIVKLSSNSWEEYKELRLRSIESEPEAWGESALTEPQAGEAYWRGRLEDPNITMFAVESEGKIAGMAGLKQKPDGSFFLSRVYTLPEMRGKGLATALVSRVIEEAKARGAESIMLGVTEGMPAINLYKRLGFIEVGKRPSRIRGTGKLQDEIVMEKRLE